MELDADGRVVPPTSCPNCGNPTVDLILNVAFTTIQEVVHPKHRYQCPRCGAAVLTHPDSFEPMGYMADMDTRRMRHRTHTFLEQLWHSSYITRNAAYNQLAAHLDIPPDQCHISWLHYNELVMARDYLRGRVADMKLNLRRCAKNRKRNQKRIEEQRQNELEYRKNARREIKRHIRKDKRSRVKFFHK